MTSGDEGSGLSAVFIEHRTTLLRFLRARGAGDNCEDILQDLWLKLSVLPSGPIADPLAYLYRSASNLLLDRRRATLRRKRREAVWPDPMRSEASEFSEAVSSERSAIAREELMRVDEALASLGERTERIFRRFRVDGVGQREIAEEIGISLSAVEKHLQKAYRALLDLRRRLDAE